MMDRVASRITALLISGTFCIPVWAEIIYVDAGANGRNNGTSWNDAYTSLPSALETASAGDQLWVAEGTYGPIVLTTGVKLYGGFSGQETELSQSDSEKHKTYISGGNVSRAVVSVGNDASTTLRGFYITQGFVDFPDMGGAAHLEKSDTTFVQCVFAENRAVVMGGAVAIWGGSPTFVNCRFYDNDGGWSSGAIFNRGYASPTFVNCLFYGNTAWEGGAIGSLCGVPRFVNCTVTGNKSIYGRGGALFDNEGRAVIRNCILWNNVSPIAGAEEIYRNPAIEGAIAVSYSNVEGGWPGEGNLSSDPLFVDPTAGDYRIRETSPCKDKGQNAFLPQDVGDINMDGNMSEVVPKDLGLNTRVHGDSVDIGAFEWNP